MDDGGGARHGIGRGEIDARELTEVYLAAIEGHPQATGIYARATPERARAEAAAAADRAAACLRRGPLDGVPVAWKDLFDTAGVATEAGSALLAGRVPDRDAPVVAAATRAGLVCLGKTHMTELAFSGLGLNPVTATPPNINDPDLAPGGSSSGSAAAVAFGLAAAGDRLGHRRLDPHPRRLERPRRPEDHPRPPLPRRRRAPPPAFDTVGPLTRSVADASLLLAALGGAGDRPRRRRLGGARPPRPRGPRPLPTREAPPRPSRPPRLARRRRRQGDRGTVPAVAEASACGRPSPAPRPTAVWRETIEARPS